VEKIVLVIAVVASLLILHTGLAAAQSNPPESDSGIGFAPPAAALAALQARAGVTFSEYEVWTIAEDAARNEIWSFTQVRHPAHPAVVRRTVLENNGVISLDMNVMCGATKAACDTMVAQFRQLNKDLRTQLSGRPSSSGQTAVDPLRSANAEALLTRFLAEIDNNRLDEAYALFGAGFRMQVTRDRFKDTIARMPQGPVTRRPPQTTWYQDPPRAPEPGTYVVFELQCSLPDGNTCLDMVVLHQPPGGVFAVQRFERTFVSSSNR
jgi:hypothetical protein